MGVLDADAFCCSLGDAFSCSFDPSTDELNHRISPATARRVAHAGPVLKPSNGVLNCVKMLAVEAHHLRATIGSLDKRASSLSCGIQHVLKMISSGESEDLSTKVDDNFWDFFSCKPTDLQKWNDVVQANTSMDGWIPQLSEGQTDGASSAVDTNDDISEVSFYESPVRGLSRMFSGSDSSPLAQLDPAFDFVLSMDNDSVGDISAEPLTNLNTGSGLVSQLQNLPGEGSVAVLIRDGEGHTPNVAEGLAKTIRIGMSKLHEPSCCENLCAPFSRAAQRQSSKGWFPCMAGFTMGLNCLAGYTVGFNLVSSKGSFLL